MTPVQQISNLIMIIISPFVIARVLLLIKKNLKIKEELVISISKRLLFIFILLELITKVLNILNISSITITIFSIIGYLYLTEELVSYLIYTIIYFKPKGGRKTKSFNIKDLIISKKFKRKEQQAKY